MRICLVYDCLFPYTVGGAEHWYRNLGEPFPCPADSRDDLSQCLATSSGHSHVFGVTVMERRE